MRTGWIFDRIQIEMQMKKIILFSVISLVCATSVHAATFVPWWTRPTVCQLKSTKCYSQKGNGYDESAWDETGNCWGKKLICADALVDTSAGAPIAMNRSDIIAGRGINPDFDVNELNGDCFGLRKTSSNGTQVAVDGKYVSVWCSGILPNPDATVDGGEVTYGAQPTCSELAYDGYVGVVNGKCYGVHYDTMKYFIDCGRSGLLPDRIIVLNGAQNTTISADVPADAAAADKLFDRMYSVSQSQYKKHFKE